MVRAHKRLHPWREPAPTRPAATILLLRDSADGLQVLMSRRSPNASFAPGAYVFPGGAVDPADHEADSRGLLRARETQDATERGFAAAALREAFEELGVLLASPRDREAPCDPALARAIDRSSASDFWAALASHGLVLSADRLYWLSHWVTDRDMPKRFDVRFFVARMPDGQTELADDGETFEPIWVAPAEALQRHERGEFNIIFPTIRTLRHLQRFPRVDALLDELREPGPRLTSCPRAGHLGDRVARYMEHEPPFGELELVAPDGQLVHRLDWQPLTPVPLLHHVRRLTAPNPGVMTGPGTNTYIVGRDRFIVIDPGPALREHVDRLAELVAGRLEAIVCTHSHPDHSPGATMLRELTRSDAPILGLASRPTAEPHSHFVPDRELQDGECLTIEDSTLRVVHTPGHAANHLCLLLEEDRLLFSGDHVLNGSTTIVNPPDGDMKDYLDSLDRLAALDALFILPAHGYVLGAASDAIAKLRAHRLAREAKVLAALRAAGEGTLDTLVPLAYDDVNRALHGAAKRSLLAHLLKLRDDGAASLAGERWRLERAPT